MFNVFFLLDSIILVGQARAKARARARTRVYYMNAGPVVLSTFSMSYDDCQHCQEKQKPKLKFKRMKIKERSLKATESIRLCVPRKRKQMDVHGAKRRRFWIDGRAKQNKISRINVSVFWIYTIHVKIIFHGPN